MKLLYDELITQLKQRVSTPSRNAHWYAFRPHLIRIGNPAGSLYVEFQDLFGEVVAESETLAISSLPGGANMHGVIRFLVQFPQRKGTVLWAVLQSTGYTYAANAHVGWCLDWPRPRVPVASDFVGLNRVPYAWEPWTYRDDERGIRRG